MCMSSPPETFAHRMLLSFDTLNMPLLPNSDPTELSFIPVAAEKAMQIAADCCIYTNHTFTKKSLKAEPSVRESIGGSDQAESGKK